MEIIHAFGLLLLMGVPIVVPEQISSFIKHAKWRHTFSFMLMMYSFACSMQISSSPNHSAEDEPITFSMPYPDSTGQPEVVEEDDDPWRCGYEWIVVEGPNGELIESQIPLVCDPHADVYMGCPPELNSVGK